MKSALFTARPFEPLVASVPHWTHFSPMIRLSRIRSCFSASSRDSKTQRKGSPSGLRWILLRRLSGNVGKRSLEYFASDFVRVFFRRVLRLGFLAFSCGFGVGRLRFVRNHSNPSSLGGPTLTAEANIRLSRSKVSESN